ncbi:Motor neuron and pancreas homeobox protein 1 [Bagarius yarrelli]|uniref:Motor neuron and pancreas homeobox protein 1 n=1 Tax=Bagarius yarrelli TaxID=175774 RepID=A0A556VAW7_BAGYA|nr:Motor neuron and pancreas homeobox protein 1 [Bagarius yarrelli]
MEKSKNFRIDAILAVEPPKAQTSPLALVTSLSGSASSSSSSSSSSGRRSAGTDLLNSPTTMVGLHPPSSSLYHPHMFTYPLGQPPVLSYPYPPLPHPDEPLKLPPGSLQLDHWLRISTAGLALPKLQADFNHNGQRGAKSGGRVKIWFQNRRMKWKRSKKAKEQEAAQEAGEKHKGSKEKEKSQQADSAKGGNRLRDFRDSDDDDDEADSYMCNSSEFSSEDERTHMSPQP